MEVENDIALNIKTKQFLWCGNVRTITKQLFLSVNHYFSKFLSLSGIPYITDCVVGELEKLGRKYLVALKIINDPRFERITCLHKGTYADDCLVQRVTQVSFIQMNCCGCIYEKRQKLQFLRSNHSTHLMANISVLFCRAFLMSGISSFLFKEKKSEKCGMS